MVFSETIPVTFKWSTTTLADGQCLPADSISYVSGMSIENGWKKCLHLDTLKVAIFSAQYSPWMLFLPCSQQILPYE